MRLFHPRFVAQLGETSVLAGRSGDGLSFANRALALARERGERGHEAYALRLLGEIAAHPESANRGTAEGYYRGAMTLADELGMRPLVARCHLGLGARYGRAPTRREAEERLAIAASMFSAMGMQWWLEKARAEQPDAPGPS